MPLQSVLFDLDDTLHDKSANLSTFARHQYDAFSLAAHGVESAEWLMKYVELNNRRIEKTEVFQLLGSSFGLSEALVEGLRIDFDDNSGAQTRPLPGLMPLLQTCKARGLRIGVVTNGRDAFQRNKIRGLGIEPVVDVVFTSGGFGVKKPDHRIFLACLGELQSTPQSSAMVGDDFAADMEPAISLGMHCIWKSTQTSTKVHFCSDELDQIRIHLQSTA
jgi:putative hydrolase of the HAD superfamily